MFQLDLSNYKLSKVFLEIKYKEIFSLPEKKFKIMDKIGHKFSDYDINSPDRISLVDGDKKLQVHIHINRLVIDWDLVPSYNDFIKVCQSLLKDLKPLLSFQEINRVGIRSMVNFPCNNQEEVTNYLINRYFSNGAKKTEFIGDIVANPRISFSGTRKTIKFNFGLNYQQEQLIESGISGNVTNSIYHYLSTDIDVYKENININKIDNFFIESKDFFENNLIKYMKNVEG